MRLIQTIKDFRKWRKERYSKALDIAIQKEMDKYEWPHPSTLTQYQQACFHIRYGINHRKEILKKVKI